jgi:hypothetical protein
MLIRIALLQRSQKNADLGEKVRVSCLFRQLTILFFRNGIKVDITHWLLFLAPIGCLVAIQTSVVILANRIVDIAGNEARYIASTSVASLRIDLLSASIWRV